MIPGPFLTIDDRLAPYRGRCRFIQYKPSKHGIKLGMCCDAEVKYNASIYCGNESADAAPTKDLGRKIVCKLIQALQCEGHSITTDNISLADPIAREDKESDVV